VHELRHVAGQTGEQAAPQTQMIVVGVQEFEFA
jgi:hypothetical protein